MSFAITAVAVLALPYARAQASKPATALILQSHHGAVNVIGRKFDYDYKTKTFVVTGDAVVNQAATTLTADRIDLMRKTYDAAVFGNV